MLNLLLDILLSSLTNLKTAFIVFDYHHHHHFFYIILISLLVSLLTLNIYYFLIVFLGYYLTPKVMQWFHHPIILAIINYLILFNSHLTLISTFVFLFLVLIIYLNPYN
jgi:hypothetical protein